MRRSSSADRSSVGPLRIRYDDKQSGSVRKSGGRSLSLNRVSFGSRVPVPSSSKPVSHIPRLDVQFYQKNRLSRGSGFGVRGSVTKDPRPISEKTYQQKCIKTVLEFLSAKEYPHKITPLILHSPTLKEFLKIFEFIVGLVIPKYRVSNKPEDEIPRFLKTIGYPFMISRSSMLAVGSPHTWPNILAALTFIIEWIQIGQAASEQVDTFIFPKSDDGFDGMSLRRISFNHYLTTYLSFLDGHDEYFEEEANLRTTLRQKILGSTKSIEDLREENALLELQVAQLEQEPDRLKTAKQKQELMKLDEEKFTTYLQSLVTFKNQQEQKLAELTDNCAKQENEFQLASDKLLKMRERFNKQEFSEEDVKRISLKRQELIKRKEDLERDCATVDEDVWKEEISLAKEVEQVDTKIQAYNKQAYSLRLIPVTAENSSGTDYEMKKFSLENPSSNFEDVIKPALMILKTQCSDSAHQKESEKIKIMEQLDQVTEMLADKKNEVTLLENKCKRMLEEIEAKKQMYQTELQQKQQHLDELQNEMVQLCGVACLSEDDASSEKKRLSAWAQYENDKLHTRLGKYTHFFQDALKCFLEHMEFVNEQTKQALEEAEKTKQDILKEEEILKKYLQEN